MADINEEQNMHTNISSHPLISVVVPVYNAEKYLEQCLDGLLAQTYGNIEIICINDGSTDGSRSILDSYAAKDSRIRVITQNNSGPGPARNTGLAHAQGSYVYCFDADDFCEPPLLEKALQQAEATNADIVALPHRTFDVRVGSSIPADWALLRDKFPGEVVNWRDNPNWIFRSFQNFPWNKLIRTSLVQENNLHFSEDIFLTEDLMFAAPALICAKRITFINEAFIDHREGTNTSVMSTKDSHPLDFIGAFRSLKAWLEEKDLFEELRVAYVNWTIDGFIYNTSTLNTYEGFCKAINTLVDDNILSELELTSINADELYEPRFAKFLESIKTPCNDQLYQLYIDARNSREECANRAAAEYFAKVDAYGWLQDCEKHLESKQAQLDELWEKHGKLQGDYDSIRNSYEALCKEHDAIMNAAEQKVGQALCYIPRRIQEFALKRKA